MKRYLFIVLISILFTGVYFPLNAQITDNFSDGDFSNNPAWTGNTALFQVNPALELQSNGQLLNDTIYLSTPSTLMNDTEWRIKVKMTLSPSINNFSKVYLVSSQADLTATLNGYYLQLGENGTADAIKLYRQDGLTSVLLATAATSGAIAVNPDVMIKVTRDASGNWTIFADYSGGTNFIQEATISDNTYTTTAHFGVWVRHSSSNNTKYYFDDVYAGPFLIDTTPPSLTSVTLINGTSLDVLFDEPVDLATAQSATNYSANNGIGNPASAVRDAVNTSLVHLTFTGIFPTGNHTLSVNGVKDFNNNTITTPVTGTFSYIQTGTAAFGDVIINEIFPIPQSTPSTGMPNAEYVELYNKSTQNFNLTGWIIKDATASSNGVIGNYLLMAGEYVILTSTTNVGLFSAITPKVVGVTSFPSLNNSGDAVKILDNNGTYTDSVNYLLSWYNDPVKDDGGWSLELINPNPSCPVSGGSNWTASNDPDGGTPGDINSVFSSNPDITPPLVDQSELIGNDSVSVCFNEVMNAATLGNAASYSINNGIGSPASVQVQPGNQCVLLIFSSNLVPGTAYTLSISGVSDCSGNTPAAPLQVSLAIPVPATFGDVIINEIFPIPQSTPSTGMPNAEYVELYNKSTQNFNLTGWIIKDATASSNGVIGNYLLMAGEYVILTSTTNVGLFSAITPKVVGVTSFPSLNNSGDAVKILDNNGTYTDSVNYLLSWYNDPVKDDGGWSLELINPNPSCPVSGGSNWTASSDPDGGTPGYINSVFSSNPDTTPPLVDQSELIGNDSVSVCFNEVMNVASISNAANYSINNGIGSPASVQVQPGNQCVLLIFSNSLIPGTAYTLSISGVSDCSGNTPAAPLQVSLAIPVSANYRDVIINEVFADPAPVIGLPNAEYIELFNRSGNTINLDGWSLSDGSTNGTIGNYILAPGEFVVLTGTGSVALFPSNTVGVISFPSLNNAGDNLGLRTQDGILIDSVNYSSVWYNDAVKDDGGWSLELINPNSICSSFGNWTASNDISGGTPGLINSVYSNIPDVTPPAVISANIIGTDTVKVCFNEGMETSTIGNALNYTIDNGVGTPISAVVIGPENQCVYLIVNGTLQAGIIHTLTISNVEDCSGNGIALPLTIPFVKGVAAQPFEVIINEFFADFSPVVGLPEGEFVEIYNRTNKVLDISGWSFRDAGTTSAEWEEMTLLPFEHAILTSDANAPLFQSFGKVISSFYFPSLNNDKDSLYLEDQFGFLIDYVFYSDEWYQDEIKKQGGWTMERIDPDFVNCNNGGNWRASENATGGTPGAANSITGTFSDTTSPTLAGVSILSNSEIVVYFDEQMDAQSLSTTTNYTIDNGIGNPVVASAGVSSVTLILGNNIQPQTLYRLDFSGLKDCSGNNLSGFTYFGIPDTIQKGDIYLNEVLFNPYTGGSDFVEIVNISDKVLDLKDLKLGEIARNYNNTADSIYNVIQVSEQSNLMLPGSILCLSSNVAQIKATYNPPVSAGFYQMSAFPSYDDTQGGFVLLSTTDTLESLLYDKTDYHLPVFIDGLSWERKRWDASGNCHYEWQAASAITGYATPGYENSHIGEEPCLNQGDVLVNEILFNAYTGGSDYTEIYNNSGKVIKLSNLLIGKTDKQETEIKSIYHLFGEKDSLLPGELLCITADVMNQKNNYLPPNDANFMELNAFPTFDDTEGEVLIFDRNDIMLDRFKYLDDYQFSALSDDNGVALERISLNVAASEVSNWHSAASTVRYGTPGYPNSQRLELTGGNSEVTLEYETFSPNGDGDKDVLPINYKFNFIGGNGRVNIYDTQGILIKHLVLNQLLGPEPGTVFWDGTTDNNQRALTGMYIILFEIQHTDTGKKEIYKNVCVLGDKM
ncbi:MAG: lamin tail domain-containing protein [Bacteroidia bacterium]|nr:lamin tail domain-containing protein [Bacteroidia bacterium]